MNLRAISVVLICAIAAPAVAAERPTRPTTRPDVVTREAPVSGSPAVARPMFEFRTAPSDLPRANIVRPDGIALRPMLPTDARPIMPMLPGRPDVRPDIARPGIATPPGGMIRPADGVRPLPMPLEGRPVIVPARPIN
jgi:hypothetical protein